MHAQKVTSYVQPKWLLVMTARWHLLSHGHDKSLCCKLLLQKYFIRTKLKWKKVEKKRKNDGNQLQKRMTLYKQIMVVKQTTRIDLNHHKQMIYIMAWAKTKLHVKIVCSQFCDHFRKNHQDIIQFGAVAQENSIHIRQDKYWIWNNYYNHFILNCLHKKSQI